MIHGHAGFWPSTPQPRSGYHAIHLSVMDRISLTVLVNLPSSKFDGVSGGVDY